MKSWTVAWVLLLGQQQPVARAFVHPVPTKLNGGGSASSSLLDDQTSLASLRSSGPPAASTARLSSKVVKSDRIRRSGKANSDSFMSRTRLYSYDDNRSGGGGGGRGGNNNDYNDRDNQFNSFTQRQQQQRNNNNSNNNNSNSIKQDADDADSAIQRNHAYITNLVHNLKVQIDKFYYSGAAEELNRVHTLLGVIERESYHPDLVSEAQMIVRRARLPASVEANEDELYGDSGTNKGYYYGSGNSMASAPPPPPPPPPPPSVMVAAPTSSSINLSGNESATATADGNATVTADEVPAVGGPISAAAAASPEVAISRPRPPPDNGMVDGRNRQAVQRQQWETSRVEFFHTNNNRVDPKTGLAAGQSTQSFSSAIKERLARAKRSQDNANPWDNPASWGGDVAGEFGGGGGGYTGGGGGGDSRGSSSMGGGGSSLSGSAMGGGGFDGPQRVQRGAQDYGDLPGIKNNNQRGGGGPSTQTMAPPPRFGNPLVPGMKSLSARDQVSAMIARSGTFAGDELGIGGLDEVLAQIKKRVWTPLAAPPQLLHELGIEPARGLLLYGPPGCGKTLLARQLGRVLSPLRPCTTASGPEIMDKFVGSSEKNLRALFEDVPNIYDRYRHNRSKVEVEAISDVAPHVIIMDEFDAVARHRGGRGGSGGDQGEAGVARDSVVNQLLAKMDGVDPLPVPTLVIGLTNKRSLLDPALLRPGRFEVQILVPPPQSVKARESIFKVHMESMMNAGRLGVKDAPEGTPAAEAKGSKKWPTYKELVTTLAKESHGFSGAAIAGTVRTASSQALERAVMATANDDDDDDEDAEDAAALIRKCMVTVEDLKDALKVMRAMVDSIELEEKESKMRSTEAAKKADPLAPSTSKSIPDPTGVAEVKPKPASDSPAAASAEIPATEDESKSKSSSPASEETKKKGSISFAADVLKARKQQDDKK